MTDSRTEFDALMAGLRAGQPAAYQRLYDDYGRHVLRVVRRKLHHRLRAQYDSTDLLQSVMTSFLAVPADRRFASPDDLIRFLASITANKVTDKFRHHLQTDKRDLNREFATGSAPDTATAADPTPSQAAIADECWERLTVAQPPAMRQVLLLLRAGYTMKEAADRTGLHPKAIQRALNKLMKRTERSGP
jgi:RNA polymerase sigma factor (sigma-70 family)